MMWDPVRCKIMKGTHNKSNMRQSCDNWIQLQDAQNLQGTCKILEGLGFGLSFFVIRKTSCRLPVLSTV